MTDLFLAACSIIFGEEGPYSNSIADPGGQTKWGVARNEHPEITDAKWAAWTQADSVNLLREKYWDAHRCDEMPWPWAIAVFDGEVNQGSVIRMAQMAVHCAIDGIVGSGTLAAMHVATADDLETFLAIRAQHYAITKNYEIDGKGWFKRLFHVARMGVNLIA